MSDGTQLALATSAMMLEEIVADHCDGFDLTVLRLEEEALLDAEQDDDLRAIVMTAEFFPLMIVGPGDPGYDDWEVF